MSALLVSKIPSRSTLKVLSEIDEESEGATIDGDFHVQRGPFGAFRLQQCQSGISDQGASSQPMDLISSNNNHLTEIDANLDLWEQELGAGTLEPEDTLVPLAPEFWDMQIDSDIQETFPDVIIPESELLPDLSDSQSGQVDSTWITSTFPFTISSNSGVPPDTVSLLKHYTTDVITLLTPFRHSKTPWHVLFIPHLKNCLAALTLGEQLDHASLAAFHGALAISAISLGGIFQSQRWVLRGKEHRQRAEGYAALTLHHAYESPKAAKYKSTVMALLTMMHLSLFAGDRENTDRYLLEVEKFIRLKGLNRRKSRKVRLLHHCYVFERLFHESTYMRGQKLRHRLQIQEAIESSGLAVHSHDSLTFRLPSWNNFDQEMLQVKNQVEGENDLHLEKLGDFPPTLYPEIFGIPESWVLLLSLTIRLGNEKDAAGQNGRCWGPSLKEFMTRAKEIESRVTQLQRPSNLATSTVGHLSLADQEVTENMLEAMQEALKIYFYRRIYDVDASILQQQVVRVRDCLLRCDEVDSSIVHGSAGFIWPAFIAACEAETPDVQASFSSLFKGSAQRSGLSSFTDTLSIVERVWQERSRCGGMNVSWLDLVKENCR